MKHLIALALSLAATTAMAQNITSENLDKARDNLVTIEKTEPIKDAVAADLAWIKVTVSSDKSAEGRVGSNPVDRVEVTITPADAEFDEVLAAIKAAGARRTKEAQDEITAMGLVIEKSVEPQPLKKGGE